MKNKHWGLCFNKTSLPSWFWSVRPLSLEICFQIPFEILPLILTSDFYQILTLTQEAIFFFIDMIKFAVRWKMISHWYSLSFILPEERNMEQLWTGSWWMTNWGLSNIRKFEAAGVKSCSLPTPETRNIQYMINNKPDKYTMYIAQYLKKYSLCILCITNVPRVSKYAPFPHHHSFADWRLQCSEFSIKNFPCIISTQGALRRPAFHDFSLTLGYDIICSLPDFTHNSLCPTTT